MPRRQRPQVRRSRPARDIPIERLLRDRDERFRPNPMLAESVMQDLGSLDRQIVPLLNALYDIGVPTAGCCAGHRRERGSMIGAHVAFEGAGTRVEAAAGLLASLFPGHRRTDVRYKADIEPPYRTGAITFVELAVQDELDRDLRVHDRYVKAADAVRRRGAEIPRNDRSTAAQRLMAQVYAELRQRDIKDRPGTLWREPGYAELDMWLHHHNPAAECEDVEGPRDDVATEARWCFVAYDQPRGKPYWRWVVRANSFRQLAARLRAPLRVKSVG